MGAHWPFEVECPLLFRDVSPVSRLLWQKSRSSGKRIPTAGVRVCVHCFCSFIRVISSKRGANQQLNQCFTFSMFWHVGCSYGNDLQNTKCSDSHLPAYYFFRLVRPRRLQRRSTIHDLRLIRKQTPQLRHLRRSFRRRQVRLEAVVRALTVRPW